MTTAAIMSERMTALDPIFLPAGVADPAGRTGYLAEPPGIVAVALDDGRPLWRSADATTPVLADDDRLFALRNPAPGTLTIVVLRDAEPILVSDPVPLPSWASAPSWVRAHLADAVLRLEWEAETRYEGGAAPPAHVVAHARRTAAGAAEVDVDSGAVRTLAVAAGRPPFRPPPLNADDLEEPWLAGTTVVRLVWDVHDGEQVLALASDDPPVVTELTRGSGLVAELTPDGRHVFVRSEPPRSTCDAWEAYAVPLGRRVATLTHDVGARTPALVGDRAFYLVEGRALRVRELAGNKLVWEMPLVTRATTAAPRLRQ